MRAVTCIALVALALLAVAGLPAACQGGFFDGPAVEWYSAEPALQWGSPAQGLQMGMRVEDSKTAGVGGPVLLVTLLNVSDRSLTLGTTRPRGDYDIQVTDLKGADVPFTPAGKEGFVYRHSGSEFHVKRVKLAPGEEQFCYIDLAELFVFPGPGRYDIVVSRQVNRLDDMGQGVVESPPFNIEVGYDGAKGASASGTSRQGLVASGARLVPVRSELEKQGYGVGWDSHSGEVTVRKGKALCATFRANSDRIVMAGRQVKMGGLAKLINGQLCAPGDVVSMIVSGSRTHATDYYRTGHRMGTS